MQRMVEQIKAISDLTEKVKQHQGEVAFCLREFNVKGEVTGDYLPPQLHYYYYYDTGIIKGEMQRNENPGSRIIKLSHLEDLRPMGAYEPEECMWGHYSIPVDRNLNGFLNYMTGNSRFDISIETLEGIKQGQILLDLRDFEDSTLSTFLNRDRKSVV